MNYKYLLRVIALFALMVSFVPANRVGALPSVAAPPVDMFQLPWDQGLAWFAIDGIDNGTKRPLTSSHHFKVGGAIDFAPHNNMVKGENTSNFWVTAAAAGTVVEISNCHMKIAHANAWITEYQFLANIQVKLGDIVDRNQRLGIIADGVRHKFCPGSSEPNVPHLHFMLRPTIIGATFAGWEVKYNSLFNKTTFTKGLITVGLFKPLLNELIVPPTPSPTPSLTAPAPTSTTTSPIPTDTAMPSQTQTPTPPSGPYVSTTVNPTSIQIGETALATVSLNNVPVEGYASAEFTCTYNQSLVEVSNIVIAGLFGTDPATAVNDPQNGSFIVAIAGSNGSKATTSGAAFTFGAKGLQAGQTALECTARVSQGNNSLTNLPSVGTSLTIFDLTPTPTATETPTSVESATPTGPPPQTQTSTPDVPPPPPASQTATPTIPTDWLTFTNATYGFEFKYPPQGVIAPGRTDGFARIDLPFVQGTNLREKYLEVAAVENANPCRSPVAASSIVESSETVTINGISFLKETGGDAGAGNIYQFVAYSTLRDNVCVSLSFVLHSVNPGNFPTPPPVFDYAAETAVFGQIVSTYTWLGSAPTATPTVEQTSTPDVPPPPPASQTATPTIPGDWLTFTNSTFGYQFQYPPQGQIRSDSTAGDTIITNLPIVQSGTNLADKYLEVAAGANATECKSLFPTQDPGVTVTINGISFLKQTGLEGAAGSIYQWVAYSTLRNGVCVSVNFILHAISPGASSTPQPPYDYATESAVFGQIISTYTWLMSAPTATPSVEQTSTPVESPTSTLPPTTSGTLTGQVLSSKSVTVSLYDASDLLVTSVTTNVDGTFSLIAPAGTYTVRATASGFLSAQGSTTLTAGSTTSMPTVTLLGGDIDGNNVIDQFDALTIGMNYNTVTPAAADLNNDGIINVLDLEFLAQSYRETGPIAWQ